MRQQVCIPVGLILPLAGILVTHDYLAEQFDFTPFTPSKFLNAFQFGQDTVFKPQYEFPAYSGEPLIPALWPQSQTESGTSRVSCDDFSSIYCFSGTVTPGTGLNNSREGFYFHFLGSMSDLK